MTEGIESEGSVVVERKVEVKVTWEDVDEQGKQAASHEPITFRVFRMSIPSALAQAIGNIIWTTRFFYAAHSREYTLRTTMS